MWMDRLLSNPTTHALELTAQFAEQRHRVLVEDIANIDTAGYRPRQLDEKRFAQVLGEALEQARSRGQRRVTLQGDAQFETDATGRLVTHPVRRPPQNVLFHDGTNARLHSLSLRMLRGRLNDLITAIRGRLG